MINLPDPLIVACGLVSFDRLLAESAFKRPLPLFPDSPEAELPCVLIPRDDIRLALRSSPFTVRLSGGKSSTLVGVACAELWLPKRKDACVGATLEEFGLYTSSWPVC